jgi:hypothetical protein
VWHYKKISLHKNRARICKPYKEPRNRFSAWRAGTTTLFFVPARLAESIPGLHKRLQIRAQPLSHDAGGNSDFIIFVWRVRWRWAGAGGRVVPAPPDRPSECPLGRHSAAPSRDT